MNKILAKAGKIVSPKWLEHLFECDILPMISTSGPIFEGPYPFFYDVSTDRLFTSSVDTGDQPGIFRL